MKPAGSCCGCFSLLFGVELICLIQLIGAVVVLASVNDKILDLGGAQWSPVEQVLFAAWYLIGVPLLISAGVGAVYKVESSLRIYAFYLLASVGVTGLSFLFTLVFGDSCDLLIEDNLRKMSPPLVCGFANGLAVFLYLFAIGFGVYMWYVIWSAAEQISRSFFPDLQRYQQRLKGQVGQPVVPAILQSAGGGPNLAAATGLA